MDHQENQGSRKGSDKKIWIVLAVILLAAVITAAVVLLSGKKKADGGKTPVTAEKGEEPPKKVTDSSTSSASKIPGDQDKGQDGVRGSDSRNQAAGIYVVGLNGWTAAQRDGGLYLTKDGKEVWNEPGEYYQAMLITSDGLFYVNGKNGSELNYYDFSQGTKQKLTTRYYGMSPFGVMDGKVYIRARWAGLDNAAMAYKMVELDLSDGAERVIPLPDMWGDFATVFCNGKLYYLGGRSDISTTPLYEVDLESGDAVVIDKSTTIGLMTDGTSVFYVHCDEDAYMENSPVRLMEFNTASQKTETLLEGTYDKVGGVCYAGEKYILLRSYGEGKESIQIYDRETPKIKVLNSQGEEYLSFIQGDEDGFYFKTFSNYRNGEVYYGKAPYHVCYYNYADQKAEEVGSTQEYVNGVFDGYIYYVKWENYEPKQGRVPFGNVASPLEIPDQPGDAKETEYILPGSDSRYYDKAELERLTSKELRLARNEIYARHGYIFESEELKQYFSSKFWYVPSIRANRFDQGVLNEYEKANLNLILVCERDKGTDQ